MVETRTQIPWQGGRSLDVSFRGAVREWAKRHEKETGERVPMAQAVEYLGWQGLHHLTRVGPR